MTNRYLVTAVIRHSWATDALGLPPPHPLYHKHACLVISNLTENTSAAHGFGFNGYLREPVPRKNKVKYKQPLLVTRNEEVIDCLYAHLKSRYTPQYSIEQYNCVDHLCFCLQQVGMRSRLLSQFRYANRQWYKFHN